MRLYAALKYTFLIGAFLGGAYLSYRDGNQDKPGEYLASGLIIAFLASLLWVGLVKRLVFGYLLSQAPKEERNRFLKQWAVWRGSRILFGGLWRLYQLVLMGCGLVLFYVMLGDINDRSWPLLWIMLAFAFAVFFTWGITVLTGQVLDRLFSTSGDKPPQ